MLRRGVRFSIAAGAALAVVGGLAACSQPEPVTEPSPTPTYTSDYVAPEALDLAPLTGVEVPAGSLVAPSISAKIDNHPAARPQVGLNAADIVFEELVEGGLTRYVGVWQSSVPAEIGPVRSIRPMDPDIISPFGGIVAYSGGQERFVELMRQTPVYNAIHGQADTAETFYRSPSKSAPHNVMVKAPDVVQQHADLGAPRQQFSFAPDTASATATRDGVARTNLALVFGSASSPSWAWNADSERWMRSQAGAADLDEKGDQLAASNVVILRVPISTGLGIPKTELIGSGEAFIASGGAVVEATWSKDAADAPIRLVDATGTVVRLAAGNSWIELVPNDGSVAFS